MANTIPNPVQYYKHKYARAAPWKANESTIKEFLPTLQKAAEKDKMPSLVFADWLEEHYMPAHAQLIREYHLNQILPGGHYYSFTNVLPNLSIDTGTVDTSIPKGLSRVHRRIATPKGFIKFDVARPTEEAQELHDQLKEELGE